MIVFLKTVVNINRSQIVIMKVEVSRKFETYKRLSLATILFGVILLIYMIRVEDEPGALPLFLILSGIIVFIALRARIKKQIKQVTIKSPSL